jgi:hypothetical protein
MKLFPQKMVAVSAALAARVVEALLLKKSRAALGTGERALQHQWSLSRRCSLRQSRSLCRMSEVLGGPQADARPQPEACDILAFSRRRSLSVSS